MRLRAVDRKSVARSLYFLQKTLAEMIEAGVRPPDVDGRQHEPEHDESDADQKSPGDDRSVPQRKSEQSRPERDGEDVAEVGSSHADRHAGAEACALVRELPERRKILDLLRVHWCSSSLLRPLGGDSGCY